MNNQEVAQVFADIGDLLEIKGEVIYKILAYRRAAETLREYNRDVNAVWKDGRLRDIPSVGPAIAEKIDELLNTGQLGFYERLKAEIPPGLIEILRVPDVGPKKAALVWKTLGITSLAALEEAARAGKLRDLAGMGERSEAKIIAGIESLARRTVDRRPLGQAWALAQEVLAFLRELPGVETAEAAGSLRRRKSTIGDLDFLVASSEPEPIMAAFCGHPTVQRILGQGQTKSSVEFVNGLQADLRVLPAARFGTPAPIFHRQQRPQRQAARVGAEAGAVAQRARFYPREAASEILCATEAEVYQTLGLAHIPPELREDRGEIEAAAKNACRTCLELDDLQSELHSHTTWSDGSLSVREMAQAARSRGLKVLAITDHSQSLGMTGGLTPAAPARSSGARSTRCRPKWAAVSACCKAPRWKSAPMASSITRTTCWATSTSWWPRCTPRCASRARRVTARLIRAIENRHVDIIGHPTGRLLPDRAGADLDMEAVLRGRGAFGRGAGNQRQPRPAGPGRQLRLPGAGAGLPAGASTPTRTRPGNFELAHFGVGIARRAWATPEQVINTWPGEKLLRWLDDRGHRRAGHGPIPEEISAPADLAAPQKRSASPKQAAPKKRAASPKRAAPKNKKPAVVKSSKPAAKKAARKAPANGKKTTAGKPRAGRKPAR